MELRRSQQPPKDELEAFARKLFHHGVYILPCGGGVIAEPRRAIRELKGEYGTGKLIHMSLRLVLEPKEDRFYPEGSVWAAYGVIYHAGDTDLVHQLCRQREQLLQMPDCATAVANPIRPDPFGNIETLIAGLSSRLGLPLPEGVRALDPQEECHLFCEGD